ncbi:cytidylyltransferase domain-containing protein [Paenibacillus cucumis (ex Kampfer et al. 2016)]|uniref:3-deoxy-manno-octulosonate cytidylyltransferase n=1 Tax=Paenibacillus cucumis (ex Kampfer et al. 2016) TaxID=1776858 RepID=A0ABS7KQ17_9BACL|nr:hypothetical protein [Paenibacillus cucumis (ex Kampfer et al. 2016)]MBY0206037.1 hypothetical protein [Paenibacillus cucumis (ex Kampfer et al. 2016)]
MKVVACIIARTNSTRLPQKVLKEIQGKALIEHIIDRVKLVQGIDEIYIATSNNAGDSVLGEIAKKNNIKIFYGSENSVIERMLGIAELEQATDLIRITGDNVFTDPYIMEKTLLYHKEYQSEYSRAEFLSLGATAEVINIEALKRCYEAIDPEKSEYLFYYIFDPEKYKTLVLIPEGDHRKEYTSLTVDTIEDFERSEFIFNHLTSKVISYKEITALSEQEEIPSYYINGEYKIKLPDNVVIDYSEFRKIINARIAQSTQVKYRL